MLVQFTRVQLYLSIVVCETVNESTHWRCILFVDCFLGATKRCHTMNTEWTFGRVIIFRWKILVKMDMSRPVRWEIFSPHCWTPLLWDMMFLLILHACLLCDCQIFQLLPTEHFPIIFVRQCRRLCATGFIALWIFESYANQEAYSECDFNRWVLVQLFPSLSAFKSAYIRA